MNKTLEELADEYMSAIKILDTQIANLKKEIGQTEFNPLAPNSLSYKLAVLQDERLEMLVTYNHLKNYYRKDL